MDLIINGAPDSDELFNHAHINNSKTTINNESYFLASNCVCQALKLLDI